MIPRNVGSLPLKAPKKIPMAAWVGAAISSEDVGPPCFSTIFAEAGVDNGVQALDLWAGRILSTMLVPLMAEVDDVSRHIRDEITSASRGDGAAGSPQHHLLEEGNARRGRGGRRNAHEIRLHGVPKCGGIGAPEVGESGGRGGVGRREGDENREIVGGE